VCVCFGQVLVSHACNSSYSGGTDQIAFQGQPRQIVLKTLSKKQPTQKKDWYSGSRGRVPAFKYEALSSNSSTTETEWFFVPT
jgi:hypothetical protein